MGTDDMEAASEGTSPAKVSLARWVARLCVGIGCLLALALTVLYQCVGDTYWFTDAVVVYPPVMWCIPLLLAFTPVVIGQSWRLSLVAAATLVAFFLINEEWRSLLRPKFTAESPRADVRVVTWNIYGISDWTSTLNELAQWDPDVVFFSETPDGPVSDEIRQHLQGPWEGYHWWDQGDSALLSRWPVDVLESAKVGPWDKPVLGRVAVPLSPDGATTRPLLVCGIRLLMPPSATSPTEWFGGTAQWPQIHVQRVNQYASVVDLLNANRLADEPVLLAGDFNVRAGSKSLGALNAAGYRDTWPTAGTGWGGTFMVEVPAARIDQVWTSDNMRGVRARVLRGPVSDHRYVVADLAFN